MRSKRIAAGLAAAVMTLSALGSCGTSITNNEKIDKNKEADSAVSAVTELTDSAADEVAINANDGVIPTYEETTFEAVDVPYVEFSKTYQAESGTIVGSGAAVMKDRANFKGDGYVNGANLDNWSLSFDLPESQFYNIVVSTASDKGVNSSLYVNGKAVWIFRTAGDGTFAEKKLENIWLEAGINEIKIESTENQVDIDCITIESNKEINSLNPDLSASTLCNANASYRAQAVYQLLCSDYGKQVLTAQHITAGADAEADATAELTGKYPAIRVSDMSGYTKGDIKDIGLTQKYFQSGGLVAYDWYWIDPTAKEGTAIEIKDVNFDLRKAMPAQVDVDPAKLAADSAADSSADSSADSTSAADDSTADQQTGTDTGTDTTYDDGGYGYDNGYGYDDGYGYDYGYGYDDGYGYGVYSASPVSMLAGVMAAATDSYPDTLIPDQQSAGSQAAQITTEGTQTTTTGTTPTGKVKAPKYSVAEIAAWTPKQYEKMYKNKDISEELYLVLKDIDAVSKPMKKLSDKNVPVIWRPLPVASNGLYWWGIDKDAYKWLWQVMYTRMTTYHELNNLIWVWSAQNADWYVGDEYCDVISADIYTDGNRDAQINTLLSLNNICKSKPIAMSECGSLPAIESVLSEKAFWSYTALWTEPYFGTETGIAIDDENSAQAAASRYIEYYNNNFTLTREELPSIPDVAKSIRDSKKAAAKAEKEAAKAAEKKSKKESKKESKEKSSESSGSVSAEDTEG